jgi:methionyl aminopeptidase
VISLKSPRDLENMAVAGRAVAAVHAAVREAVAPGITTKELDVIGHEVILEHDCRPSFLGYHGYPASICTSPNSVIVHGIPADHRLREGDIIAIDAGANYEGWHADAAFTMGVGEVAPELERLLSVTEASMWAGIRAAVPGGRLGDIGAAIQAVIDRAGFGIVREYTGHGIGRQMHEEPQILNYGTPGKGMRLKAGMVVCIEPMVNIGGGATAVLDDGWTVVTADGSASAHFEHTVAITGEGPRILTAFDPAVPGE